MSETVAAPQTAAATAPSARFGFVKFVVGDLEAMRGFYERAFGLAVSQTIDQPDFMELILRRPGEETGFSLILFWYRNGEKPALGSAHGPLGLFVRDVDAAYAHAIKEGATADREPYDTGAMRVGFVRDPEGRELELISMRR
jgi:predicted enzyme related to lactoylglutathione lyase